MRRMMVPSENPASTSSMIESLVRLLVFSSFADDGAPPGSAGGLRILTVALPVVTVGLPQRDLDRWFAACRVAGRVDNGVGLENEEQGKPVQVCTGRRAPWAELWPEVTRLG